MAQGLNLLLFVFLFPETRRLYPEHVPTAALRQAVQQPDDVSSGKQDNAILSEEVVESNSEQPRARTIIQDDYLGRGRPSRAQFGLLQPIDRDALRGVLRHFFLPVRIFFFPIVMWASMSMGASANCFLEINLLQSPALSAPPYNFSPAQVGYTNFSLVVGGIIGLLTAGPWSDWISARATRKNNGIREPEMRLISLAPFIAAALIGLVVSDILLDHHYAHSTQLT